MIPANKKGTWEYRTIILQTKMVGGFFILNSSRIIGVKQWWVGLVGSCSSVNKQPKKWGQTFSSFFALFTYWNNRCDLPAFEVLVHANKQIKWAYVHCPLTCANECWCGYAQYFTRTLPKLEVMKCYWHSMSYCHKHYTEQYLFIQ